MRFEPSKMTAAEKEYWTADPKCAGLSVRVQPTGKRTYYFCRRVRGSRGPVKIKLDDVGAISLDEARIRVAEFNLMVMRGEDPRESLRREVAFTFADLWTKYAQEASGHKKTFDQDQQRYDLYLKKWATREASAIRRGDVVDLHLSIGKDRPYQANRVLALLRTVFQVAVRLERIQINPASEIKKYKEKSRERFLDQKELVRFFEAVKQEHPTVRDYFLLSLLIGQRASTMRAMRWDALDLDSQTWSIKETKNGDPLTVALVDGAVEILKERQLDALGPWVFPSLPRTKGPSKSGHMEQPKAQWERIREAADLKDVRIHDLRRTVASWMAADGASLQLIGRYLGHKTVQATQVYSRLTLDPVRAVAQSGSQKMLDSIRSEENAKIVG